MSFSIIAGDLEDPLILTVNEDLTDVKTYALLWRRPDGTEATLALEAVDLAGGVVRHIWLAGETDMAGVHRGRIVVTWEGADDMTDLDDRPQTFPNDGTWFLWWVYP